jgi:hypothetical protein
LENTHEQASVGYANWSIIASCRSNFLIFCIVERLHDRAFSLARFISIRNSSILQAVEHPVCVFLLRHKLSITLDETEGFLPAKKFNEVARRFRGVEIE